MSASYISPCATIDSLPRRAPGCAGLLQLPSFVTDRRTFLKAAAVPAAAACLGPWLAAPGSAAGLGDDEESRYIAEARYYSKLPNKTVQCQLCPRQCVVSEGKRGHCRVRENRGGKYYTLVHSRVCTAHIDPIEKKPFFHVYPGERALSIATGGCNVNCKFCQNWEISQAKPEDLRAQYFSPQQLAKIAKQNDCVTLAYTYSEPIVFYEYMSDAADGAHTQGIKSVVVSNGFIRQEPLRALCGRVDAIKVDLKAFSEKYYREVVNGELKPVLETLVTVRKQGRWLEIVYLVVPTLNDRDEEFRDMSRWIKAELGPDVPIHFTRFQPLYLLRNLPPTPVPTLERAKAIADAEGLHYVYLGNVPGHPAENTYCPKCRHLVIERAGFTIAKMQLKNGSCPGCQHPIPGVWKA
ncbi:MAG: AmmeMemoRadiSam system radical SAM enzyme [Chlamydiota bacterium]